MSCYHFVSVVKDEDYKLDERGKSTEVKKNENDNKQKRFE